jgi:hypothetical protein
MKCRIPLWEHIPRSQISPVVVPIPFLEGFENSLSSMTTVNKLRLGIFIQLATSWKNLRIGTQTISKIKTQMINQGGEGI